MFYGSSTLPPPGLTLRFMDFKLGYAVPKWAKTSSRYVKSRLTPQVSLASCFGLSDCLSHPKRNEVAGRYSPLQKSVPSMSSVVLFASAAIAVTRQLIGELALGTVALQREVSVIRMLLLEAKIRC